MNRSKHILALAGALSLVAHASANPIPITATPSVIVSTNAEPIPGGKFQPTWESLSQYKCPEWFRDVKFGIWAHWGAQCKAGQCFTRRIEAVTRTFGGNTSGNFPRRRGWNIQMVTPD